MPVAGTLPPLGPLRPPAVYPVYHWTDPTTFDGPPGGRLQLDPYPLGLPDFPDAMPAPNDPLVLSDNQLTRLRAALDARGVARTALAGKAGTSTSTLAENLTGRTRFKAGVLRRLLVALHEIRPITDPALLAVPVIRSITWPTFPKPLWVGVDTVVVRFTLPTGTSTSSGASMLDGEAMRRRALDHIRDRCGDRYWDYTARVALSTTKGITIRRGDRDNGMNIGWDPRNSPWWLAMSGSVHDPEFCRTVMAMRAIHGWMVPLLARVDYTVEIPGHPLTWLFDLPDTQEHDFIWNLIGKHCRYSSMTPGRNHAANYRGYAGRFWNEFPSDRTRIELEWRPCDPASADIVMARRPPWQQTPLVLLGIPDTGLSEDEIARLERAQRIGLGRHRERLDPHGLCALDAFLERLRNEGLTFDFGAFWDRAWPWHHALLRHLLVDRSEARFDWT